MLFREQFFGSLQARDRSINGDKYLGIRHGKQGNTVKGWQMYFLAAFVSELNLIVRKQRRQIASLDPSFLRNELF